MSKIQAVGDLRKAMKCCDDGESLTLQLDKGFEKKTYVVVGGVQSSGGGRITVLWLDKEGHPDDQWLLLAVDEEDGQTKEFALQDCDFLQRTTPGLQSTRERSKRGS